MTAPAASSQSSPMVRILIGAIAFMTLAIIVLFAAVVAKLINPDEEEGSAAGPQGRPEAQAEAAGDPSSLGTIDFAAAPVVEIGLPPGVRVVETHVSADRATFVIETVQGERGVYTTPLEGYDGPVRMVFHTLE